MRYIGFIVSLAILTSALFGAADACTSFCLDNGGHPVFGANLDYFIWDGFVFINKRGLAKEGPDKSLSGKTARWTSKYGSVTFNMVCRDFAWAGINEAGLVLSTMWLEGSRYPDADRRPPLATGIWMQYQLDNFATVAQVIASDSLVRIDDDEGPLHFLVCDSSGTCATIEFLGGVMVVHTGDDLPYRALTNTIYANVVALPEQNPAPQMRPKSSPARFVTAAEKVAAFNPAKSESAVDYAFDILSRKNVGVERTRWSIVFDHHQRRIHFITDTNRRIRSINMTAFDFSCRTPVMMLDLHEDLVGEVSDKFIPYSSQRNLNLFYHFCQRFGIELTVKDAVDYIDHFEGFICTE